MLRELGGSDRHSALTCGVRRRLERRGELAIRLVRTQREVATPVHGIVETIASRRWAARRCSPVAPW